jgi:hypothetical protein
MINENVYVIICLQKNTKKERQCAQMSYETLKMIAGIHSLFAFIMIVLYVVILFKIRNNSSKPKMLHHLLRFDFLIVLGIGFYMFFNAAEISGNYHIKATLAIIMFGLMEVSLSRLYKGKNASIFIGLVFALIVLIILMGYGLVTFV